MSVVADTAPSVRSKAAACEHCGLPVAAAEVQRDQQHQFCCNGCRVAYQVINGCGLSDYYRIRDGVGADRQAATGRGERYAAFDSRAFLDKHVRRSGSGLMTIELRLEGVHCAACVWLVERLPNVRSGVVQARLSLTSCAARVVWDPTRVRLSEIACALDQLGYAPHPARDTSAREARVATERKRLSRVAVAGALAGNNMLIALALYAGVLDGIEPQYARFFRAASMVVGWGSLAWPGSVFFRGALASLRLRASSLDQPIALALGVGAVAGTVNVLLDRGDIYFDSLSVLVFLLLVGRYLQARQQCWASDAVAMAVALTPDTCRVVRGDEVVVDTVEALEAGDTVEVLSGDLFPADGQVVSGQSAMNAALLTGEAIPTPIGPGTPAFSGAINVGAVVRVRVSALGDATRIGELQRLVAQGLETRTPLVQFTDRVARWFTGVVVLIAAANFGVWAYVAGVAVATDTAVAVLIVACPCALGLATPLTMALAVGRASREGALVKSADVLERLACVGRGDVGGLMIFDKTGTLTRGEPEVAAWHGDLAWAPVVAGAERTSSHPVALAIGRYCQARRLAPAAVDSVQEHHGYGLTCQWQGQTVRIGAPGWAITGDGDEQAALMQAIHQSEIGGLTVVAITCDNRTVGVVSLSDAPHSGVERALRWLSAHGWKRQVLSGDNAAAVAAVAREVGIHPSNAHGQMTPEAKFEAVRQIVAAGKGAPTPRVVAMVGDGVNDAAALAAADVGIAVCGGAEAALAAADVYLSRPGIGSVVDLVQRARHTMKTARRNLMLSLAYNLVAVVLASAGMINALVAAVLMPLSSAAILAVATASITRGDGRREE